MRKTINGIKLLIGNLKTLEREHIYLEDLKLDLLTLLIELEEPEINKEIEDETCDSDSENCLRSMLKTTQEHLQMDEQNVIVNTIYVIKNQAVTAFLKLIFSLIRPVFNNWTLCLHFNSLHIITYLKERVHIFIKFKWVIFI